MDIVPHTVLWIKTLLLHDNVQYKSVQKQSWHTGVLINAAVKRELGVMQSSDCVENEMHDNM